MDPTNADMEWMTERARELVANGMGQDEAITQALEEGEARCRVRRAEEWQRERAMESSLRELEKQRKTRDRHAGGPALRASFGDLIAAKKR